MKSNLADDEEIQELYRSSMALRPKIVKSIDKYSQKRADLVSMNETFLRARNIFDRVMEDSLVRHTAVYSDQAYNQSRVSTYNPLPGQQPRPDSRVSYTQSPGSSASVDNLPNPYAGPGVVDASSAPSVGASAPGMIRRESSLPDPYANAASSSAHGSPTSPASASTAFAGPCWTSGSCWCWA
ncbi:hypothetical protein D9758_018148 [Tetrapyrgos nigripes]|uniref:Uncharacterized protein n=1 Tax=Tetrapyrgos nigripes TaxID=182062 RepID=A0A8H5F258_9AGAR|nr:hypothetical protein D9758_018148 [Tetrapyrgos nigripes]